MKGIFVIAGVALATMAVVYRVNVVRRIVVGGK